MNLTSLDLLVTEKSRANAGLECQIALRYWEKLFLMIFLVLKEIRVYHKMQVMEISKRRK